MLDPRGADSEEQLDAAVRAAASIAHALARSGGCGVLLPGDRRPADLDGVARRAGRTSTRGWRSSGRSAARRWPSSRRAAARSCSSARAAGSALPQALADGHGAARVLVVPGAIAERRAAFAVAGCSGYITGGPRGRKPARSAAGGAA